jgi:hypothetical protein
LLQLRSSPCRMKTRSISGHCQCCCSSRSTEAPLVSAIR